MEVSTALSRSRQEARSETRRVVGERSPWSLVDEVTPSAETPPRRDPCARRDEPREVVAGFEVNRGPVGTAGRGDGSAGRARTYNPSVNSRMLYH